MKIGINGYEAVVPRFGFDKNTGLPNRVGSAEVCFELLVELEKRDKKNEYTIYLPVEPTKDMPQERKNWRYNVIPARKFWTLLRLPKAVRSDKLDVFFSPTHYASPFIKCPEVIAILDVSYKHFPEMFKKKDLYKLLWWGKYSVKKAKKIITISVSSKDDIIKEYGVEAQKVEVIHPGIKDFKESKMEKEEVLSAYGISSPYVLFVGTIQPRKNVKRLIQSISLLRNKKVKLVIIGKKGWMYGEILSAPEKFGIAERVIFLHDVANEALPVFYKNAKCFILPSLYEGFGLPVLEAMHYSCPVITSNISSLPEAGGDAALYVNPEDVMDIAAKIDDVLESEKLRERMIKLGHAQVKKFSWETSAKETLKVLEEVGHSINRVSK